MPRRKAQAVGQDTPEELEQALGDDIQPETMSEADEALQQFLEGIDDEAATVTLYRLNQGRGRRPAYLFNRLVTEVSMPEVLEALRDDYGGGSFRLEVRAGNNRYITAKYIEVEAPKRPLPGHEREREPARELERSHPVEPFDLTPLLDLVERSNAQHREMLNTLVTAMKPERRDVNELVESLAALDRLRPTPAPASSGMGVKDLLEAFQLFETIRGGGDGGGTGSTGWDVLRSAVGSFFPMLQAGMMPALPPGAPALTFQPAPQESPSAQPAGGARPAPVSAEVSGNSPAPDRAAMADHMQRQLELLLRAGAENRDPYTYASLALDELGAEPARRLFLSEEGWAAFAAQVPAAQQLAPWFAEFRAELGEILQQEEGPGVPAEHAGAADNGHADGPPAGPGGDPAHVADHGAPGGGRETGSGDPGARA